MNTRFTSYSGRTNSRRTAARRMLVSVVLSVAIAGVVASSVGAHVNTAPQQVKPGKASTVDFVIGHGCGTSPTTSVAIKMPPSVTKVAGIAPKGWKVSVANSVVTFSGGSLPDKVKGNFGVTFTAPTKTGPLVFPTVQSCAKGKNSWIDAPLANGDEPDNPAPIVVVTNASLPSTKKA